MKEVKPGTEMPKAEFVFSRFAFVCEHNYFCAVCKEKSAVLETWNGILQPCWECQKSYRVVKLNWLEKLFSRGIK